MFISFAKCYIDHQNQDELEIHCKFMERLSKTSQNVIAPVLTVLCMVKCVKLVFTSMERSVLVYAIIHLCLFILSL